MGLRDRIGTREVLVVGSGGVEKNIDLIQELLSKSKDELCSITYTLTNKLRSYKLEERKVVRH